MHNLGQQAANFGGDESLLAEQLISFLQNTLNEHLQPPDHFDNYRRRDDGVSIEETKVRTLPVLSETIQAVTPQEP